jgi:hypothetical protein
MPNPTDVFIDPGAGSDGTGDGSIGNPYQTLSYAHDNHTKGADGTRYNVKAGTTLTTGDAAISFASGTPDAPLYIQGYTSAAGDGGRCHIDTGSTGLFSAGWNYVHVQDVEHTSAAATSLIAGIYSSIINCILNYGGTGNVILASSYTKFIGNELHGTVSANAGSDLRYNKITHSSGYGITITAQSVCHHNVIISQSGATGAILLSGHDGEAVNNSCYATATVAYGIRGDDVSFVVGAYNNLVQGYTTAFSNVTNANKSQMFCNSSFGHTTLESFAAEPWYQSNFDNTALAESPFVDAAGDDFTPKNITGVNNGFGVTGLFRGAVSPAASGGGGNIIVIED